MRTCSGSVGVVLLPALPVMSAAEADTACSDMSGRLERSRPVLLLAGVLIGAPCSSVEVPSCSRLQADNGRPSLPHASSFKLPRLARTPRRASNGSCESVESGCWSRMSEDTALSSPLVLVRRSQQLTADSGVLGTSRVCAANVAQARFGMPCVIGHGYESGMPCVTGS